MTTDEIDYENNISKILSTLCLFVECFNIMEKKRKLTNKRSFSFTSLPGRNTPDYMREKGIFWVDKDRKVHASKRLESPRYRFKFLSYMKN